MSGLRVGEKVEELVRYPKGQNPQERREGRRTLQEREREVNRPKNSGRSRGKFTVINTHTHTHEQ